MHRQRSPVRERNVNDVHQTRAAAEQFLRTLPPLHARRQLERQDAQHRSPGVLSAECAGSATCAVWGMVEPQGYPLRRICIWKKLLGFGNQNRQLRRHCARLQQLALCSPQAVEERRGQEHGQGRRKHSET